MKITVPATREHDHPQNMSVAAVLAKPENADWQHQAHWLLLSSEGDETPQSADRICKWYESRWTIEEYFRILKAGMSAEYKRHDDVGEILDALGFSAVQAWYSIQIQRIAQSDPTRACDDMFDRYEFKALSRMLMSNGFRQLSRMAPEEYTIKDFAVHLGKTAGFAPTKKYPIPGLLKLWSAVKSLLYYADAYRIDDECKEEEKTVQPIQNGVVRRIGGDVGGPR